MHSYVKIDHFLPEVDFPPIDDLTPLVERIIIEKRVRQSIGKERVSHFKESIWECLRVYYQLLGISTTRKDHTTIPSGILPRYVESLINYFSSLGRQHPRNKEITILQYSGVHTIKVRYKYTESVIKKLVKLGLRNPKVLEKPLKIFLNGGALHDLVGILFVCTYPYEREWVARALYNFFEYNHRTDDHLLYGFYTVQKASGYKALHCDRTLFNPRFDPSFYRELTRVDSEYEKIFTLLDEYESDLGVLQKLRGYFNIEIQLHTTLEHAWSTMEHANSYNVLAKGVGRSSEITVQWKMLSDALKELEMEFQRLQIDTEQSSFKEDTRQGYTFVYDIIKGLDQRAYRKLTRSVEKIQNLRELFESHEFSRHDYVQQLQIIVGEIDEFASRQSDITVKTIMSMQSAFIYYRLANHSEFFNNYDIQKFVKASLEYYELNQLFLDNHPEIFKCDLISIIAIIRYLRLTQKFGLGLIYPHKSSLSEPEIPPVNYKKSLFYFQRGLSLLNLLSDADLTYLKEDNAAYVKIIHRFDVMAREWELFSNSDGPDLNAIIVEQIRKFRARFINRSLLTHFNTLLDSNKIKNVGFIINFYATMIWHGLYLPIDALKRIIKYSAYDKIDKSDLFYYELAAYRFFVLRHHEPLEDYDKKLQTSQFDAYKIKHYRNYHRENMINLLFQIKRQESVYVFEKARLQFEMLTGQIFKIDHFSDTIIQGESTRAL